MKKISMDKIWTDEDKLFMEFGKHFEDKTGKDFILELSHFLYKNQYKDSYYEDENGKIFPARVFGAD